MAEIELKSGNIDTLIREVSKGVSALSEGTLRRWNEKRDLIHAMNMCKIVEKARAKMGQESSTQESSKPFGVESGWLLNFLDKSKTVSDDEMQDLWASILAGEANNPGSYSTGTINLLPNLDQEDANLFVKLNSFTWLVIANRFPLIFDLDANIYRQNGITAETLILLDEIGLINYGGIQRTQLTTTLNPIHLFYENKEILIEAPQFDIGVVTLTRAGRQLLSICKSPKIEGFYQYVKDYINNNMPQSRIVSERYREDSLCPWLF